MSTDLVAPVVSLTPLLERGAAREAAVAFRRAASGVRRANALGRARADAAAQERTEALRARREGRAQSDDAATLRPACEDPTGDPRGEIDAPATSDGIIARAAQHTQTMEEAVQVLLRLGRHDLVEHLVDEHLTACRLQSAMRRGLPEAKRLRARLVSIRTTVTTALEAL